MRFPFHPALAAVAAGLLLCAAASARAGSTSHPGIKPQLPAELRLVLVAAAPGKPVTFETQVKAYLPLEDVSLSVTLPSGARWVARGGALPQKLDALERRALSMSAALPQRGHAEITARLTFRLPSGGTLSRGAYLAFDDGGPARQPNYRATRWNGSAVVETPAQGVSR